MGISESIFQEAINSGLGMFSYSTGGDRESVIPDKDNHFKIINHQISVISRGIPVIKDKDVIQVYKSCMGFFKTETLFPFGIWIDNTPLQPGFVWLLEKKVRSKRELRSYVLKYGNGFKKGFEGFDEEISHHMTPLLDSTEDKLKVIFGFATRTWRGVTGPGVNRNDTGIDILGEAENDGRYYGQLYKAWSIILQNQYHFKPLALEYFKRLRPKQKVTGSTEVILETLFSDYDQVLKESDSYQRLIEKLKDKKIIDDNLKVIAHLNYDYGYTPLQWLSAIGFLITENNHINKVGKTVVSAALNGCFSVPKEELRYQNYSKITKQMERDYYNQNKKQRKFNHCYSILSFISGIL